MWTVHIPPRVEKELAALPQQTQLAIRQTLQQLQHEARPPGCKKLKGRLHCWRVRVGSHRLPYDIDDSRRVLLILKIGPRKDVYRFLMHH